MNENRRLSRVPCTPDRIHAVRQAGFPPAANGRDQRLATKRSPTRLGFIASPLDRLIQDALGIP
jgi:hypothetical protein